jgi:putative membrane protein
VCSSDLKRIPAVGRFSKVGRGKRDERRKTSAREAQVAVLASGNLGLIYFNDWKENLSQEEMDRRFPNLISGLVQHEGIGFALVQSDERGPVVLGRSGRHYLETGRVDGEDPLADFGPLTAERLRRTALFKNVPDILVNSIYDREKDEVAAFEELIGSHGGAGGRQTSAFLMYPADWNLDEETIVGTEQIYAVLRTGMEAAWSGQGQNNGG